MPVKIVEHCRQSSNQPSRLCLSERQRRHINRIFAIFFFGAWLALPALAQETSGRNEFAVYLGAGHVEGREGTYGKGLEHTVSLELRPFSRMGVMFAVNRLVHSGSISNPNGTPDHWDIEGTEIRTSGSLVYHFENAEFKPYVFGGVGALRSSRTVRVTGDFRVFGGGFCLVGCTPTILPTRREEIRVVETKPALLGGAGIRVPLAWRLSFRPEVQLVKTGSLYLVNADLGLSCRW
jgi:hypothetical protein